MAQPAAKYLISSANEVVPSGNMGGGVGPWVVGLMNDAFQAQYGDAGIRQSLVWVQSVGLSLAGVCYLIASRTLARDMEGTEE